MKRTGASTATVAALFIVGLIIGAGAIYGLGISTSVSTTTITGSVSTKTVTVGGSASTVTVAGPAAGINASELIGAAQAAGNLTGTFTIAELTDLTDGLAGEGIPVKDTTQFAIHDIDAWLKTTNLVGRVNFTANIQDYALDNVKATTAMNSFLTQGIHVVVGPLNSGTAGALLPFANDNQIVMLSPSSTNPRIAIAGDYLIRSPPSDFWQGQADALLYKQSGVTDLVILYRNDGYGAGLANSTSVNFKAGGGQVEASIPYDTTTTAFGPYLQSLNSAYLAAVAKVGAAHVGVYVIAFDEFGLIATQAQANYDSMLKSTLPWFGTDGEGNEAPIVNSTYASAVLESRMAATFPGFTVNSLTLGVCARLLSVASLSCDGYSIGAYEDTWISALAILYCHGQNGLCMKNVIPPLFSGLTGTLGTPILNSAGDSYSLKAYSILCIVPGSASGSAKWLACGTSDPGTGAVTWTVKPTGIP